MTLKINKITSFEYSSTEPGTYTSLLPSCSIETKDTLVQRFTEIVQSSFFATHFKEMLDSTGSEPIRLEITLQDGVISVHREGADPTTDKQASLDTAQPEELNKIQETVKTIFHQALWTQQQSSLKQKKSPAPTEEPSIQPQPVTLPATPQPLEPKPAMPATEPKAEASIDPDKYKRVRSSIELPFLSLQDTPVNSTEPTPVSSPASITIPETIKQLYSLAESFASIGSLNFVPELLLQQFHLLPDQIKWKIYFETYVLLGMLNHNNDCQFGENIFLVITPINQQAHPATNTERAMIIHLYIMKYLASEFESLGTKQPPAELETLYNLLPQSIRQTLGKVEGLNSFERSQKLYTTVTKLVSEHHQQLFIEQFEIQMKISADEQSLAQTLRENDAEEDLLLDVSQET